MGAAARLEEGEMRDGGGGMRGGWGGGGIRLVGFGVEGRYLYNWLVESAPSDPREIDGPSVHADGGLNCSLWAVRV
jgi:hypothetical protein